MIDPSDEQYTALQEHWAAYGRFIHYFSQVEQRLQNLLWELTGVPLEIARATFQDARFNAITILINRITESRGETEHPMYRRAIDQLGLINRMRNDIVHLGAAMVYKDGRTVALVSNTLKAMPGKDKEFEVSVEMLDNMSRDLQTALACIAVANIARLGLPPNAQPIDWSGLAQQPWLYKPPQQSDAVQARRKRPPSPRHPRAPSHQ